MSAPLDLDQLRTFCAIADCGSFTEAARRVHKTQSAVSMQIKRLEERLGHSLLCRQGRGVKLTSEGETVYAISRKMLRLNADIMDMLSETDLRGTIRFGIPDDFAVRLLPIVLSGFQRTHPGIIVDVKCMTSEDLLENMRKGRFDVIVFSQGTSHEFGELFRTERVLWVSSQKGAALDVDPLPIATGQRTCCWTADALNGLNKLGSDYRVAFTSSDATAISSAVMADLAVGFLCESSLHPGLRIVDDSYGLPKIGDAQIALLRASHAYGGIYDALAKHITATMGNLEGQEDAMAAE